MDNFKLWLAHSPWASVAKVAAGQFGAYAATTPIPGDTPVWVQILVGSLAVAGMNWANDKDDRYGPSEYVGKHRAPETDA